MAGVREALDLAAHSTESDIVLYFGAQWCSACRVVQQSQQVSVHLGQRPVIYVSFDIDNGEADQNAVQVSVGP
jgi:thiol:disulfide interchange protein